MKLKYLITLGTLAVTAVLTTGAASAQTDYTFSVPVEMTDLHAAIQTVRVTCHLRNTATGSGAIITSGYSDISITDRDYSGTVSVVVPLLPNQTNTPPSGWSCGLSVNVGGSTFHPATATNSGAIYARDVRGMPVRFEAEGSF
jgi:hypothetical protein